MNDRTRWDENSRDRDSGDYRRQQIGGSNTGGQPRQQAGWSGQQGGWNDDERNWGDRQGSYGQPQQREPRRSGAQQGGAAGWSNRDEDIGARSRDDWNRLDDWRAPGSQSFAADYGQRIGGADYDRSLQGRTGYSGSANPDAFGRGYGPDYGRDSHVDNRGADRGFLAKAGDEIASWFGDDDAQRRREQDYRGHGPSDYTRTDERIREDVNDRLTDDPRVDARKISVKVDQGEVTLNGTVSSREAKRRAEDSIDRVSGVKHVQNNLRIEQREQTWQGDSTGLSGMSGVTTPTSTSGTNNVSGAGHTTKQA
jgi:osmotically-inducible protein OsmY